MGTTKLSFDVDADKAVAIRDYIRNHAADISFLRFPNDMKVTKVEISLFKKTEEEPSFLHVRGILRGDYTSGDGIMSKVWPFSCTCRVKRGKDDEPVVSDLAQVINESSF